MRKTAYSSPTRPSDSLMNIPFLLKKYADFVKNSCKRGVYMLK